MGVGIHFGIDTSNYTTSAAAVTDAGEVFCAKRPLSVPLGERGMRQSDALFCHTRDLPEVIGECLSQVKNAHGDYQIRSVGVSKTPRREEGSYMPCFLAGVNAARSSAALAGVPLLEVSHQEGHIAAALLGAEKEGRLLSDDSFLAFHLSGGTTELVLATREGCGFTTKIVAETLDLTLGQLIDRCGVALGLPFPAGAHLEELALSGAPCRVKIPVKDKGINLSGFENRFQKRLLAGEKKEDLARFVFSVAIAAVEALIDLAGYGEKKVLFSGGVSSSRLLREHFQSERFFFAPPAFCADNAIGVADLSRKGAK